MKNQINILLVEDDEVDVMNMQRAFQKNKITNPLYIVNNGIEALDALLKRAPGVDIPQPGIILLDINMPKMGGLEFLAEMRKHPALKSISVFIMTTSNDERDKVTAYNHNVAGYILKPLSHESFTDAVSILNHYWHLCELPGRASNMSHLR